MKVRALTTAMSVSAALIVSTTMVVDSFAGVKKKNDPTIIMKAGNRAGLQYLYAWDARCRPVNVQFRAIQASKGRLYTVPSFFKISRSQSAECAGRSIPGKKVVFKANRGASGKTVVQYRIASKNVADDYIITRPIMVNR